MARKHNDSYVLLGLNIAYFRKRKGLTQEKLAEAVNVSRTHISNIEATKVQKSVSLEVLFDIAEVLEVPVGSLFQGHE